ncbi:voltage-gated potassium channel [Neocallimastix californiae]|uniref:Voltage-gated potassium channel n=1 Tax=Neocallimastix californiae TaxID=1754190 RepID=A0A1Y2DRG6_9FUNG|nr:voltage-gated potassium channel [Neocallimastix californiae]|eukprot:ORY61873.1 voltage-gated potassium channel [Neocallimastix californiae]
MKNNKEPLNDIKKPVTPHQSHLPNFQDLPNIPIYTGTFNQELIFQNVNDLTSSNNNNLKTQTYASSSTLNLKDENIYRNKRNMLKSTDSLFNSNVSLNSPARLGGSKLYLPGSSYNMNGSRMLGPGAISLNTLNIGANENDFYNDDLDNENYSFIHLLKTQFFKIARNPENSTIATFMNYLITFDLIFLIIANLLYSELIWNHTKRQERNWHIKRFYHDWKVYKFIARYKGYFKWKGTINLLGILAFYIEFFFPETRFRGNKVLYWIPTILSEFLIIRLFLRIVHMKNGFAKHFNIVVNCLRDNSKFLFNVYTIFYLGVLVMSPIYYHSEIFGSKFDPKQEKWISVDSMGEEKEASVHSIVESSWWAAVTMVCIGYGDYYPFTVQGKIVAFFGIMFSMFLFLIPNAILYATFADDFSKANRDEAIKNAIDESNKRYRKRQKKMFKKRRESTFLSSPSSFRPRRDEDIDNLYTIPKKASADDHEGLPEILYMIKNNIKNEETTIEDISDNEEEVHILKDKDEVESLSSLDSDDKSRKESHSNLQTTTEETNTIREINSEKLEEFYDNKEDIINEMMDYCEICDKELVKTSQKLYTLTKMKKYYEILIKEYSEV